jgi:hypothetical protein
MVPSKCTAVLHLALLVSSSTVRSQPVPFDPEGSSKQRQQREKHASTLSLWGAVAVAANISSWGLGLAGSVAGTAYSTVYDLGFGGKCNLLVMRFGIALACAAPALLQRRQPINALLLLPCTIQMPARTP